MKKTLLVVLLGTLLFVGYQMGTAPTAQAAGATIASLQYPWMNNNGLSTLATPLGKVIFNVPDGRDKMNLTYIIQGGAPSTDYNVGFDISADVCTGETGTPPSTFGGVALRTCGSWAYNGLPSATAGVYQVGTLSTDADGDGDLHVNLKGLPTGTFHVVFWVAKGVGSLSPVASTASYGDTSNYQTVNIP